MITKKKLKTKFDYEVRTFGLCALLLFVFTVLFVNPQTNKIETRNSDLQQEIKIEENLNNRLQYEHDEIMTESTVKNDR